MIEEKEFYRRFDQIVPEAQIHSNDTLESGQSDIYFERMSITGLEEMHRYSVDERLYEFFEFDPFDSVAKTKAYIEKLIERMGKDPINRNAMYWFVKRKNDGYLIGSAGLVNLNYARRSIEWGYGIDPQMWGCGYILQLQESLKKYVFETLQLNRLHGITMVKNQRTISSVLSAGMKLEGIMRQYYRKGDIYYDGWAYSMLAEEYFQHNKTIIFGSKLYSTELIIEIVSSVLTEEEISKNSTMLNVASWDSLNHMTIMVAISERTGINLSPTDVARAVSVRAIESILNHKN
jgi:RimJ/RimL family protein N-acetyltransferase/acyl carrier protein